MPDRKILVLKFGGTSLGNRDSVARVMEVVRGLSRSSTIITVTSAMAGVTDRLLALGTDALSGKSRKASAALSLLRTLHEDAFESLAASSKTGEWIRRFLDQQFVEITGIVQGISLLGEFSDKTRDKLLSYGEILSSNLLARLLADDGGPFIHSDARDWIVAEWNAQGAILDFPETERRVRRLLAPLTDQGLLPVVPGFICRTSLGEAATLGRNGSDYSVLHPKSMIPAVLRRIPIRIKNTFNSAAPGTLIAERSVSRPLVKTVTSIRNLALLNVQGSGMLGIPGVSSRLFEVLARENINVMMISQSSSEHSICTVIQAADSTRAVQALRQAFHFEITRNLIEAVEVLRDVAIVSIIGAGMRGTPGISGKFFEALGKCRINVLAIAQGSSELSISAVIWDEAYRHAVQAIHTAFGLTRDLNVFLFGCGKIGRTLLKQIHENRRQVTRKLQVNLRLLGVANSKYWCFSPTGLTGAELEALGSGKPLESLPAAEPRVSSTEIFNRIAHTYKSDVVLVDATGAELAATHIEGLRCGFHVVTANKKPLSTSLAKYHQIRRICRRKGLNYQYEATFGAGLPLLSTLQDLIYTGDRVLRVQGCLSGTLGFICGRLDEGLPFSAAVTEAMSLGYTEPDPRDDLSGMDVARKSLIIAREMGIQLEFDDIDLQPMLQKKYFRYKSVADFLRHLPAADEKMRHEVRAARSRAEVLRFTADITAQACRVGLHRVPRESPIGRVSGPDNILLFQTQRYYDHPLVIQGPGAGAGVTAAGVLSDILKIAKWI